MSDACPMEPAEPNSASEHVNEGNTVVTSDHAGGSAVSSIVGAPGSAPPPPPPTWVWPREAERIEVEVAGEDEDSPSAWMAAAVTAVLIDGWFSATMDHDLEWVDWFTWQEVRTLLAAHASTPARTHTHFNDSRDVLSAFPTRGTHCMLTDLYLLLASCVGCDGPPTTGGYRLAPRGSETWCQGRGQAQGKRCRGKARIQLGKKGRQRWHQLEGQGRGGSGSSAGARAGVAAGAASADADGAHILGAAHGVYGRAARRLARAVEAWRGPWTPD